MGGSCTIPYRQPLVPGLASHKYPARGLSGGTGTVGEEDASIPSHRSRVKGFRGSTSRVQVGGCMRPQWGGRR